jgi:hypothetical protein
MAVVTKRGTEYEITVLSEAILNTLREFLEQPVINMKEG